METKVSNFQIKSVSDQGQVQAVIARKWVKDKDGDVTVGGAIGSQTVTVLPAHDWSHSPIGKGTVRETDNEAVANLRFNLELPSGRDWFRAIKFDFENPQPKQQWSYGYDILDSEFGRFEGERVQLLRELRILEVSPVIAAAGIDTRTVAVKQRDVLSPQLQAIHDRVTNLVLASEFERTMQRIEAQELFWNCQETLDRIKTRYLETSHVTSEQRELAANTIQWLCKTWDLSLPPARWFSEETYEERQLRLKHGEGLFEGFKHLSSNLGGTAINDSQVWLHKDLEGEELVRVAAHEIIHCKFPEASEEKVREYTAIVTEGVIQ